MLKGNESLLTRLRQTLNVSRPDGRSRSGGIEEVQVRPLAIYGDETLLP